MWLIVIAFNIWKKIKYHMNRLALICSQMEMKQLMWRAKYNKKIELVKIIKHKW